MIRRFLSKKPTALYTFRYERPDGEFREITVPSGHGRFRLPNQQAALELAERRLSEQFGDTLFLLEEQRKVDNPDHVDPAADAVRRSRMELHQRNYSYVGVTKH